MSDEPKIRVEGEGLTTGGAAWLERRAGIIGLPMNAPEETEED